MRLTLLVLLTGLTGPMLALAMAPVSEEDGPYLILHAPWTDGVALVEGAGARVVGPYQARMGILADTKGVAEAVSVSWDGAWAVLDGRWIAALCGVEI